MPRSPEVNGFRHPQGVAREVEVELTPPEPCPVGVPAAPPGGEVVSKPEILEPLLRHLPPGSAGAKLDHSLADAGQVGAELHQHLGGDALTVADQAEQQVLGANVVVVELERLAKGELQDLLGPRREPDVAGRGALALPDDLLDLGADRLQRDTERLQRPNGDALALAEQAEQQVLGGEVVVVAQPGFVLGKHNHPSSPVGEGSGHRPHSRNATAAPSHLARYTMASRTIPQIGPGGAGFDSRADSTRTVTGSSHEDPRPRLGCGWGCRRRLGGQWARGAGS